MDSRIDQCSAIYDAIIDHSAPIDAAGGAETPNFAAGGPAPLETRQTAETGGGFNPQPGPG